MSKTAKPLKVAAIGDIHVKEDEPDAFEAMFAEISQAADVLVLAGDVTDLGRPREAEVLGEQLKSCSIPVVAVLGNHDHECGSVDEVTAILKDAGVHMLQDHGFAMDGVSFVGVKGFAGGFGRYMLGSFGEPAIKAMVAESTGEAMALENALRLVDTDRTFVVLHYAPIPETIKGEPPEIYPFLGSSRLAETIDRFKVDAIVHGHAHHGTFAGKTPAGTPVYNVAAHIKKPGGKPYALIEV